MRYCGREFNEADLILIRQIAQEPGISRYGLSRRVCAALGWHKLDGGLKDMSCRVALLRMQREGLISLPEPKRQGLNNRAAPVRTAQGEPAQPIKTPAGELKALHLYPLDSKADSRLWNEYIDRYHYLGHQALPGAQLRYFARAEGQILALFGFGAAAWKTAPRDRFIGWSGEQRQRHLHLIVNNARFLILPWIFSKHLASKLLGRVTRRLAQDWFVRYGYRPVLLETFVETARFAGTSYKAANWLCLGTTQGRGKLDTTHAHALPRKSVWVQPLCPHFRQTLTA